MNINELEKLAKSATPGPWHWECDDVKGDQYGRKRYQVITTGKTVTRIYYSILKKPAKDRRHNDCKAI